MAGKHHHPGCGIAPIPRITPDIKSLERRFRVLMVLVLIVPANTFMSGSHK